MFLHIQNIPTNFPQETFADQMCWYPWLHGAWSLQQQTLRWTLSRPLLHRCSHAPHGGRCAAQLEGCTECLWVLREDAIQAVLGGFEKNSLRFMMVFGLVVEVVMYTVVIMYGYVRLGDIISYHIISYIIYHISYMIYDIWYMIYDTWHMIYEYIWYIIYHVSYIIYDIWYIIYHVSYIIYHIWSNIIFDHIFYIIHTI